MNTSITLRALAATIMSLALFCIGTAYAGATQTIPGAVIIGKREGDAVLLWQTNDAVQALHASNVPTNAMMKELIADGVTILVQRAPQFRRRSCRFPGERCEAA